MNQINPEVTKFAGHEPSVNDALPSSLPSWSTRRDDNIKVSGSHRVKRLEDTIQQVMEKSSTIGLTRLSDTTDLDFVGIPNYSAICPSINFPPQEGCISVFTGKGVTKTHAKASALMEAVERYSCLGHNRFLVKGSYRQLVTHHNVAHPWHFIVQDSWRYQDDEVIEWVPALSLYRHCVVLVPAWMVFTPYIPSDASLIKRGSSTNGLASGNTIEEAMLHALYEAIERDAELVAEYSGVVKTVDDESITVDILRDLIDRFHTSGLQLQIKEITQDIPVSTFLAICVDKQHQSVRYINGGKGTHLDPTVAITRAITEASQSRVTAIAGIREDMEVKYSRTVEKDFQTMYDEHREWYEDSEARSRLDEMMNLATDSVIDDLEIVLNMLQGAGVADVLAVDLTRPELGIPVARVLVTGLEFKHPGNWVGERAQRARMNTNLAPGQARS